MAAKAVESRKTAAKLAAKAAATAAIVGTTAAGQMMTMTAIVTKTAIVGIVTTIGGGSRTRARTQTMRSRARPGRTIIDHRVSNTFTYDCGAVTAGENVDRTHAFAHVCI